MIRDGNISGENIYILNNACHGRKPRLSLKLAGYSLRGGRMKTTKNYECTWDLYKSMPSLSDKNKTILDETLESNQKNIANSSARLADKRLAKLIVKSMGFSMQNRIELLKLSNANEDTLAASRITDWLSSEFFETEFWYMWVTTLAFQSRHSAVEFKCHVHRIMLEFTRIEHSQALNTQFITYMIH